MDSANSSLVSEQNQVLNIIQIIKVVQRITKNFKFKQLWHLHLKITFKKSRRF